MKCPNCQSEIADGLNFCPQCGTNLSEKKVKTADKTKSSRRDATFKQTKNESGRQFDEGSKIGRYTIQSFLGSGGTGEVYEAIDEFEKTYALKILPVVGEETYRAIEKEFEARRKINDFTHVVRAYQPELHENLILYPIEYLSTTLENTQATLLKLSPKDREQQIREEILPHICHGIEECHEAGLLHLDIKPSNILYDVENGNYKVTDFGISRVLDENEGRATTSIVEGTMAYMAPEQMAGSKVDERTDVYALGVLLNVLYYGSEIPEEANSPFIDEIVDRCTERAPSKRFSSVAELREAFRKKSQNVEDSTSETNTQSVDAGDKVFSQLLQAIEEDDLDTVRKIVGRDKKILRSADTSQKTALHHSIEMSKPVIADILMNSGSNPNHQDINGETPLHKAVRKNLASTTMNLLFHGSEMQIENDDGKRPASYAKAQEVKTILETYQKREKKEKKQKTQGQNKSEDPNAVGWPFVVVMLGIMAGMVLIFYFITSSVN